MKNYTSTVPAAHSIDDIERLLVRAGARAISKQYADGEVTALSFVIACPETQTPIPITLPANPDGVYGVLKKLRKQWRAQFEQKTREQARRTAWRLMLDWCAVQLSLIEMKQAELLQVFMPYVRSGNTTYYQQLKENRFKALTYQGGQGDSQQESPKE